jgi:rare lipoprotein A
VEPEPRDEPRARYGNRTPYTVLGKVYRVMENAEGYVERGIASWYGEKFHGRATSSFEPYDMYAFSAAHRTLPLPTYARVTNLENGRSVVVRVNDRGPFHHDRLIDLSYAAAVRLDMLRRGTARVEVRALTSNQGEPPAPIVVEASKPDPQVESGAAWVQVASFGERDNARRLARQLEDAGLGRVRILRAKVAAGRVFRVRIGPLADRATAHRIAAEVRTRGYGQPSVIAD